MSLIRVPLHENTRWMLLMKYLNKLDVSPSVRISLNRVHMNTCAPGSDSIQFGMPTNPLSGTSNDDILSGGRSDTLVSMSLNIMASQTFPLASSSTSEATFVRDKLRNLTER
eukprot:Blabericola_migrator_1__9792@NODE_5375_length_789_cov_44_160665_g3456_i0_p1_GENE_NODE_5375_length_789_cov_44_160665_g3456_i0NODE_5375_length_789_cov_44_160665_g3456_i0_p1_ORF_typecomplete_len112_score11_04_NODE_5375_length_789_cov_44_160665_g3456_i0374709